MHAAAHNLMARLRKAVALTPLSSPNPALPTSALPKAERKAWQRRQRQRDTFGRAQPCTWRLQLVKVAAEVFATARRVVVRLAGNWPYLDRYHDLCERLPALHPSG